MSTRLRSSRGTSRKPVSVSSQGEPRKPESVLLVQVVGETAAQRETVSKLIADEAHVRVVASVPPHKTKDAIRDHDPHMVVLVGGQEAVCDEAHDLRTSQPGAQMMVVIFHLAEADKQAGGSKSHDEDQPEITNILQPVLRGLVRDKRVDHANIKRADEHDQHLLAMLTTREREILTLTAEGHTIKQIAQKLHRAYGTVARHRENIMNKLQLNDRVALTRFAIRTNLARA
jgi:DNA-binding NarL/FixJ family response regulator